MTQPTNFSAEERRLLAAAVRRFPGKTIAEVIKLAQQNDQLADELLAEPAG